MKIIHCWGAKVEKADGTKEFVEGEYEVASSDDHIYKLLKKKDGIWKYNKNGDIHISVHHATSKKPTNAFKLGSKDNLKIREFSSVARDGRITSPCRGHMYKNTSNKKLNKYEKSL